MSYFHDATIRHEGSIYHLSAAEGRALESGAYSWHGPGDPSSGLAVDVVNAARVKATGAPETVARELAAQALGISVESLDSLVRWNEEYMRWHDGVV